jgi:chitinase
MQQQFARGKDVEVGQNRVWLTSPNGTRYQVQVADNGTLTSSQAVAEPLPPPPQVYVTASASVAATSTVAARAEPSATSKDGSATITASSSLAVNGTLKVAASAAISSVSTLAAAGALSSGTANLLVRSEQFNHSAWAATLASGFPTVERNVSNDPNGQARVDELTVNYSGSNYVRQHVTGLTIGQTYTLSCWVQTGRTSSASRVRLTTNNTSAWSTGASSVHTLSSTLTRVSVTWTQQGTTSAALMIGSVQVDGTGDDTCLGNVRIWGAMLNVGVTPATYVATGESEDTSSSGGVPSKVFGIYYEVYHASRGAPTPQINQIPTEFNLIYCFHCKFNTNGSARYEHITDTTAAEIQAARTAGQKVILTLGGGQGNHFIYTSRTQTQALVTSLKTIISDLGGVDGIDWNNYEGSTLTTDNRSIFADELIWAVQELRKPAPEGYGSNFMVTSPSSPNEPNDQFVMQRMNDAGALTYAAPQFYDWSGFSDSGFIKGRIDTWVNTVMRGDATKVVVGFPGDYLSRWDGGAGPNTNDCIREWTNIKAAHPNIRGCFAWSAMSSSGAQHTQYGYQYTETRLPNANAPNRFKWIADMHARVTT